MVMDVERIQKVGKLAQELVSHGMADDMQQALKQAEDMLTKTTGDEIPQTGSINTASVVPKDQEEYQLKIRKLLYQMNKHTEEISNLKEQIFQITKDLGDMKKTKHIIAKPCNNEQTELKTTQPETNPVQESRPAQAVQQNNVNSGNGNHARTGAYSSNDVSIEKYFYCGGK